MRQVALYAVLAASCSFQPGLIGSPDDADVTTDVRQTTADAPETVAPPDAAPNCPATYTASHGASRYRVGSGSWYAGQEACAAEGAHLVVIEDAQENAFVRSLDLGSDIWIGLSDHLVESQFRWVSGLVLSGYTPWRPQEPSNSNGNQDCVEMTIGGLWNDTTCNTTQTYVCECDGVPQPTTATWCVTGRDNACNTCDDDCDAKFDEGECSSSQICRPDD